MLKNPVSEKLHRYKNEVAAADQDIERLENEKKEEWATIKDFGTVDSVRANSGEVRIRRLAADIKKLRQKRNRLQKFIDENDERE